MLHLMLTGVQLHSSHADAKLLASLGFPRFLDAEETGLREKLVCTSMCVETVCLSFCNTSQAAKTPPTWTGQQLLRPCQEQNSAAKT